MAEFQNKNYRMRHYVYIYKIILIYIEPLVVDEISKCSLGNLIFMIDTRRLEKCLGQN